MKKNNIYYRIWLIIFFFFLAVGSAVVLKSHIVFAAAGDFVNIGTAGGTDGSADAVTWSPAFPIMIDSYGKYIVMVSRTSGSTYHFEYSNDNSTWNETASGTGYGIRVSSVYDSVHDKIHVIQANGSTVKYYRYSISRDKNYNITDIVADSTLTTMVMDSIGSCTSYTSDYPLVQFKDNGSNGILVVAWSVKKTCAGVTVTETRASMRVLSNTSADGTTTNWAALNGTDDSSGATGPSNVPYNKLYGYAGSAVLFQHSLFIRGGSGSKSNDIYYVTMDENSTHGFRRLTWNSGSSNWSGTWTTRATFGGDVTNSSGYGAKNELMSKLVYDSSHDRVYIGIARWLDATNGDTQSLYYIDSSDAVTLAGNVYSAGGAAWFAPTMDIMYNQDDSKIYYFFETSSKDPNTGATDASLDGKGYYKTYDGSSFSTASSFFLNSGYTIDIPIVYQSATQGRILLFFRADGAEGSFTPPHSVYWGYLNSGGSTSVPAQSITSPFSATTVANFDKICTTRTSTEIQDTGGGEIALASSFRDDFSTPLSPYSDVFAQWTSGTWAAGSFTPAPTGTVNVWGTGGAYMYGNTTFNKKTLEFKAEFTNNNFEHIGWDDGNSFGTFIIFSTSNNGQLNARVNGTTYNLGSSYYGAYHIYKISWATGDIKFFIDGVQVASDTTDVTTSLNPIISNNTVTAGADLLVDWINVVNYPTTAGTFVSCALDSGTSGAVWGTTTYTASVSGVTVKTRSSTDNSTWSAWSSGLTSGDTVTSTAGRYLQYQLTLTGTTAVTPTLDSIAFTFSAPTPTPTPTPTPITTASSSSSPPSTTEAPHCSDQKPPSTPDLFQIDAKNDSATIYFSPISSSTSSYMFSFGYFPGDQRFGASTQQGQSTGVLSYTIHYLSPGMTYYLRVRGGNGCMPGDWGNEMKFTTMSAGRHVGVTYYKNFITRIVNGFPDYLSTIRTTSSKIPSATGACTTYVVKPGDSLWKIATLQLGSGNAFEQIKQANNLSSTILHSGQNLKIGC